MSVRVSHSCLLCECVNHTAKKFYYFVQWTTNLTSIFDLSLSLHYLSHFPSLSLSIISLTFSLISLSSLSFYYLSLSLLCSLFNSLSLSLSFYYLSNFLRSPSLFRSFLSLFLCLSLSCSLFNFLSLLSLTFSLHYLSLSFFLSSLSFSLSPHLFSFSLTFLFLFLFLSLSPHFSISNISSF